MNLERGAVIIPAYGKAELTDAVVADCLRESDRVQVVIVDNAGDLEATRYPSEVVILRPGRNLGWLRGTNYGMEHATPEADWLVALNNDTRLSEGFFAGLAAAVREHPAGLVAPCYDDHLATQNTYYSGPLDGFKPEPIERPVPVIDGTCVALATATFRRLGPMNARHFGRRGWGGVEDWVLRANALGGQAIVTHRSYLTHARGSTARTTFTAYERYAASEMRRGLRNTHGPDWRQKFNGVYGTHRDSLRTRAQDVARYLEDRAGLSQGRLGRR